jgi:hypothetical protein
MEFRELLENEIDLIWKIDRSEFIQSVYVLEDENLSEKRVDYTMDGWPNIFKINVDLLPILIVYFI